MDTIVKGCRIEHEALITEQYGDEVMFAGWNPQLSLMHESFEARTGKHARLAEWASMDVDAFVKKMYEYQC